MAAVSIVLPDFSDLALLAAVFGLAGAYLLARHLLRRWRQWIVVDGSNVLHWRDNQPKLETLQEVLAFLTAQGFAPGVVFDANAGHPIANRYLHDNAFGKLLGLPDNQIIVVLRHSGRPDRSGSSP